MPPRFRYWTIVIDGAPTAFRAAKAEELLPTLRQIQRRHSGAELRWFAGGRYWTSPREAEETAKRRRQVRRPAGRGRRPPAGPDRPRRR